MGKRKESPLQVSLYKKTEKKIAKKIARETGVENGNDTGEESGNGNYEEIGSKNGGETLHSKKYRISKRRIIANIFILIGIVLIAVPLIATAINTNRNEDIIDEFLKQSEQAMQDTGNLANEEVEDFYIPEDISGSSSENTSESAVTTQAAVNESTQTPKASLKPSPPKASQNPSNQSASSQPRIAKKPLMSREEILKRMTGVLIIRKIGVKMIVMDGSDDETLRVAAGRLPGTGSLDEVGNCVLAGHRSYTFGKYFNRLDELKNGDEIVIQTKTKILKYKVYEKLIVTPDDVSIASQDTTDKILTLVTCHPVAIASHRLVIHAKQVE